MSYNIKNFAQTVTYTVNDSTANTNAVSLTLLGKSLPNYGTYFNQNFVWLMENFSSDSANPPPYAVQGQLWWDSTYKFMNVYDGSTWKTIYGNLATINANTSINTSGTGTFGNLTTTGGIYWANGVSVVSYGNTQVSSYLTTYTGTFGTLSSLTSGGTITGGGQIIGYHTGALGANTPNTVVATSVTTSSGGQHIGYLTGALGANTPNTVVATSVTTSSGGQHIGYLTGAIGANTANTGAFTSVTTTSTIVSQGTVSAPTLNATTIGNTASAINGNLITASAVYAGTIGNTSATLRGTIATNAQPNITSVGNLTGLTSSAAIIPSSNNAVTLGNATAYWSTVYGVSFIGTSTTATYADLAEKYLTDIEYEIGTVVMVGGSAEVTQHNGSSIRAIGVVSAYPAYKMNDGLKGGTYIALKGRVPVKVVGPIKKGDSLAGTAHGIAYSQAETTATTFAIALENYTNTDIGLIEAVIL
jgi:hypothetical protein